MKNNFHKKNPLKGVIAFGKIVPNAITICAFCCGLTAMKFAWFHNWELAVICILFSAILDAFDGRVARYLGQSSQFGAELDSLSDLVCFGVAPPMLLFMKSLHQISNYGWGICMFFTVCCAFRLARFNVVQISNTFKPEWTKEYFSGVPAPAGAVLALFPLILYFDTGNDFYLNNGLVSAFLIISGILMVSTIKTFSSKMIKIEPGYYTIALIAFSVMVIFFITDFWFTLTSLITLYIVLIPYSIYLYIKKEKHYKSEYTKQFSFIENSK